MNDTPQDVQGLVQYVDVRNCQGGGQGAKGRDRRQGSVHSLSDLS